MKKSLRNEVKNKNIELKISLELLKLFFKQNATNRELIVKFMTRMQNLIINHQLKLRQNTLSNFNKKTKSRNQYSWKVYIGDPSEKVTNINISDDNNKSFNEDAKSDIDNLERRDQLENVENMQNKSCLSDNEVLLKTKVNFLKVLKDVTKNIADQMQKEGKDLTILRDSIPQEDKLQTIIEHNLTFNNIKQEQVKAEDISIQVKAKTEEVTNSNSEKVASQRTENLDRKKKEACKCHCLVF